MTAPKDNRHTAGTIRANHAVHCLSVPKGLYAISIACNLPP